MLDLPRGGKATALTAGAAAARHDVLVFADARQRWAADALVRLLENFADPTIGAVSGDLVVESAPGVMAGVGVYWKYEKLLRRLESRISSTVGVSGSIAPSAATCSGRSRPAPCWTTSTGRSGSPCRDTESSMTNVPTLTIDYRTRYEVSSGEKCERSAATTSSWPG